MTERIVAIFGTSRAEAGDQVYTLAEQTGKVLAEAGFTIANGGYGGTMLASAKAAAQAGGKTIGVTCTSFGRSKANRYISREITTDSLDERLDTLINLGQGYVVLPGSTGTLLELAMVWELKNKGFLKTDKPIILVGEFWKPLVELMAAEDTQSTRHLCWADGPEQTKKILVGCI